MGLVLITIFGTFLWDRLVTMIFAPEVTHSLFCRLIGLNIKNALLKSFPIPNCQSSRPLAKPLFVCKIKRLCFDSCQQTLQIFRAMIDEARRTTLADLLPMLYTLFKVVGGLALLGTGNPLLWFAAFWIYRKRNATPVTPP